VSAMATRRRLPVVILATCMAPAVAGCGGDGGSDRDELEQKVDEALEDVEEGKSPELPSGGNACKLADSREVEGAFGGTSTDGRFESGQCAFEVTDSDVGVDGSVFVRIEANVPVDVEEVFRGTCGITETKKIDGVGDEACYDQNLASVYVRQDQIRFAVQGVFLEVGAQRGETVVDQARLEEAVVELAREVAEDL
jgi:hypothetical protein